MSAVRIEGQWIVDAETGDELQLFESRAAAEKGRQRVADRVHREINRPIQNPKMVSFGPAIELHEDQLAASDNGAGSERQFGYCADEKPIVIAFAAKAEQLPSQYIEGLMRHEFGHALEFRYGRPALEKLYRRLPDSIERRADKIAEHVFGDRIEYGDLDIQCIGCGGKKVRPRRLG